jgi:polysaccharide deacetylase 2 family uncharacterized protein YibQ
MLQKGPIGLLAACGGLVVLLAVVGLILGPGEMTYVSRTVTEMPLPTDQPAKVTVVQTPQEDAAGPPANANITAPAPEATIPLPPDLALVDASPFGPLPRISSDGRRPVLAYGRPYDWEDERPKIAVLVGGLGLQSDATNAALHLPGAFSLVFSPYSEDLPSQFERARLAGHEVLIDLPMEPADYPGSDPGPHTLRASGTVDANLERLHWVLARAPGFFAVAGRGGAFGASPEAPPIIAQLAERGLGLIEVDGTTLSTIAGEAGLPYAPAPVVIDREPSSRAIDEALAELEANALEQGWALGAAEPYPVSLERLVAWSESLEQKGLALVPASAVLIERAGLLGELAREVSRAAVAN